MATIKEAIQGLFELDKMSPEKADEMLIRLSNLIFTAVLIRVLPELTEEDLSEYERLVDSEVGGEELFAFFCKKIPEFNNIVKEEAEDLYAELMARGEASEPSETPKSTVATKPKGCLLIFLIILLPIISYVVTL